MSKKGHKQRKAQRRNNPLSSHKLAGMKLSHR